MRNVDEHVSLCKKKNSLDFKHYEKAYLMIFGSHSNVNQSYQIRNTLNVNGGDQTNDNQIMRSYDSNSLLIKSCNEKIGTYDKANKILDSVLDLMKNDESFLTDGIDILKV